MNLIQIAPDVIINADQISGIRIVITKDTKTVIINAGGERYIATIGIDELLANLKAEGLNNQYWAGR